MMVQFSLPSKLVGSKGSLSLKRPKKQTRGTSVSAWANLWMEWREKFWWEYFNGIDGSVQYGAALMIRWREQHGPGGKHWWECTVWCSPHDQVEGAAWAWGQTLFCWGNVLEVTPSNPMPNPQSPPPTPIYKFEDLVAKQHNLYNKWKWSMYKLWLVPIAISSGSFVPRLLAHQEPGYEAALARNRKHILNVRSTVTFHSLSSFCSGDNQGVVHTKRWRKHKDETTHYETTSSLLSSSSTDKATCFVPPDSERASPPAIEQCTS